MTDPRYHMRGPSAPLPSRTEAERRALLDRLGGVRDRMTDHHADESRAPRATPSAPRTETAETVETRAPRRHSAPRATRTDPTTTPPPVERPSLPEILREESRGTAPHSRATEATEPATRQQILGRQLRGETTPEERGAAQESLLESLRERGLVSPPRRGAPPAIGERPLLLQPPRRFAEWLGDGWSALGESWDETLEAHPDAPPLGILEGGRRTISDLMSGIGSLLSLLASLPELPGAVREAYAALTPEERDHLFHLMVLDREGIELLREIIAEHPELLAELGDILMMPFDEIAEHFYQGYREAEDGHGTESAARIIQGTTGFIGLLEAVGDLLGRAARSPRLVARLQSFRRRLAEALEGTRSMMREFPLGPSGSGSAYRRRRGREGSVGGGRRGDPPRRSEPSSSESLPADPPVEVPYRPRPPVSAARLASFRAAVRRRRMGRGLPQMREIVEANGVATSRRVVTSAFSEWALDRISADPSHPLWAFIDESTGTFRRPDALSSPSDFPDLVDHMNDFCLEMGHIVSRSSGEPERIALQWSYHNQIEGLYTEGRRGMGSYIDRGAAVEIGGVPVDRQTALLMETSGIIPPGTVARARPHSGFRFEDWSVAGTPDGDLIWTRR